LVDWSIGDCGGQPGGVLGHCPIEKQMIVLIVNDIISEESTG
jgi:hypothetical protein